MNLRSQVIGVQQTLDTNHIKIPKPLRTKHIDIPKHWQYKPSTHKTSRSTSIEIPKHWDLKTSGDLNTCQNIDNLWNENKWPPDHHASRNVNVYKLFFKLSCRSRWVSRIQRGGVWRAKHPLKQREFTGAVRWAIPREICNKNRIDYRKTNQIWFYLKLAWIAPKKNKNSTS